jgi:hypothetical protein
MAVGKVQTGSFNGMEWTAESLLTGAAAGGTGEFDSYIGNAIYHPSYPANSGVVGLLMDFGSGNRSVCSGTLLSDRQSILTAGHCVSDGAGTPNPLSTTVFFQPATGLPADTRI